MLQSEGRFRTACALGTKDRTSPIPPRARSHVRPLVLWMTKTESHRLVKARGIVVGGGDPAAACPGPSRRQARRLALRRRGADRRGSTPREQEPGQGDSASLRSVFTRSPGARGLARRHHRDVDSGGARRPHQPEPGRPRLIGRPHRRGQLSEPSHHLLGGRFKARPAQLAGHRVDRRGLRGACVDINPEPMSSCRSWPDPPLPGVSRSPSPAS